MKDHNERTQFSLYWQSLKDSPNESPELLRACEYAAWNAWKTRASMDAQAQQEPRADMTNQQVDATLGISRLIIGLPTSDFEVIQKFAEHMGVIPQALVRRILSEWVAEREPVPPAGAGGDYE